MMSFRTDGQAQRLRWSRCLGRGCCAFGTSRLHTWHMRVMPGGDNIADYCLCCFALLLPPCLCLWHAASVLRTVCLTWLLAPWLVDWLRWLLQSIQLIVSIRPQKIMHSTAQQHSPPSLARPSSPRRSGLSQIYGRDWRLLQLNRYAKPLIRPPCTPGCFTRKAKRSNPGPCLRLSAASRRRLDMPGSPLSLSSTGILPIASNSSVSIVSCPTVVSAVPASWATRPCTALTAESPDARGSVKRGSVEHDIGTCYNSMKEPFYSILNIQKVILTIAAHVSTSTHPPERASPRESSPSVINTRDQLETRVQLLE